MIAFDCDSHRNRVAGLEMYGWDRQAPTQPEPRWINALVRDEGRNNVVEAFFRNSNKDDYHERAERHPLARQAADRIESAPGDDGTASWTIRRDQAPNEQPIVALRYEGGGGSLFLHFRVPPGSIVWHARLLCRLQLRIDSVPLPDFELWERIAGYSADLATRDRLLLASRTPLKDGGWNTVEFHAPGLRGIRVGPESELFLEVRPQTAQQIDDAVLSAIIEYDPPPNA